MSWLTRKRGTPRQVGKKFPVLEKKKLPPKLFVPKTKHSIAFEKYLKNETTENLIDTKTVLEGLAATAENVNKKMRLVSDIQEINEEIEKRKSGGKTRSSTALAVCSNCGYEYNVRLHDKCPRCGSKIISAVRGGKISGPRVWTSEYGWLPKGEYDKTERAARERQEQQKFKEQLARRMESKKFTKPGVFEYGGEIFILKPNRSKTGFYTLKLVERKAARVTEEGRHVPFDFEYAPDVIYKLTESDRMSLNRAKHFLIRYGKCIACGRKLKVAKSVEQGMGPVCIKYFR